MAQSQKAVNAGVHNSSGIEFQKHCALYLLFERYVDIKDRNYFICLEHHDDVLFCFLTQSNSIEAIDAYQAKKASVQWSMGEDLIAVLKKLTETGLDLLADPHPKEKTYKHSLGFLTNHSIQLHCGTNDKKKKKKILLINESNANVQYHDIDAEIQNNILSWLKKASVTASQQIDQLENLSLLFLDLPKKAKGQKDTLVGQFTRLFDKQVNDPTAAVESLLLLFRDVETTLNNGGIAKLMDQTKRVESSKISSALNVITTQVLAFEFWRARCDDLCTKLSIPVFEQDKFKLQFQNSFDLFKDIRQGEHRKLLQFVLSNKTRWAKHTIEVDCIKDIYECFKAETATNLSDIDIKAAVCAAYLEIKAKP